MNTQRRVPEPSHRRATYQDVLDAPAHMVAEITSGTLHTHPRPAMRHARASSGMGAKISPPFDNAGDQVDGEKPNGDGENGMEAE